MSTGFSDSQPSGFGTLSESAWNLLDEKGKAEYLRSREIIALDRHREIVSNQAAAKAQRDEINAQMHALKHTATNQGFLLRAQVKTNEKTNGRLDALAASLAENTAATKATDEKVDKLIAATDGLVKIYSTSSAVAGGVSSVSKWLKDAAWIVVPLSLLAGAGVTFKEWLMKLLHI